MFIDLSPSTWVVNATYMDWDLTFSEDFKKIDGIQAYRTKENEIKWKATEPDEYVIHESSKKWMANFS